ncbi:hypothetical protein ACWCPL_25260, partial [Streptomyces sp. NPDC001948]
MISEPPDAMLVYATSGLRARESARGPTADANVLIVACEFCSLCYQPTDLGARQSARGTVLPGGTGERHGVA